MGVVVFDSDVFIGYLNARDAHHADAVALVGAALAPGTRRLLCAVNYSEVLIGPLRAGVEQRVDEMLAKLAVETVSVDASLAREAAAVRATTGVSLPDAYAIATAQQVERRGFADVRLASFDERVLRAQRRLQDGGSGSA